jgi:hypothetical protein
MTMTQSEGTLYQIAQICDLIEVDGFAANKLILGPAIAEGTAPAFGRALSEARDRSLAGQPLPISDDGVASALNESAAFVTLRIDIDPSPLRFFFFVGKDSGLTARLQALGWMAIVSWRDFPALDVDSILEARSVVIEASFKSLDERRGYAWASDGRSATAVGAEWIFGESSGSVQDNLESFLREVISTGRES